jgi:uncharacterized membrane protein YfcA
VPDPVTLALAVVVGLVAGFASGLLGIGGGVIMVPGLLYGVPGLTIREAQAASLFVISVATLLGIHRHHGHGHVDWRRGAFLGLGVLGAAVASLVAEQVAPSTLEAAFGGLLLLAGLRLAFPGDPQPRLQEGRARDAFTLVLGLAAGLISGFFGVGGGVVIVPGLALAGVPMHTAVATSLVGVLLNAVSGTVTNAGIGYGSVLLAVGVPTAVGSLLGIRSGADAANALESEALRRLFGGFLVLVGVYMALESLGLIPGA